jgi:hypothetical protein
MHRRSVSRGKRRGKGGRKGREGAKGRNTNPLSTIPCCSVRFCSTLAARNHAPEFACVPFCLQTRKWEPPLICSHTERVRFANKSGRREGGRTVS